jgi:hypothetical protein
MNIKVVYSVACVYYMKGIYMRLNVLIKGLSNFSLFAFFCELCQWHVVVRITRNILLLDQWLVVQILVILLLPPLLLLL